MEIICKWHILTSQNSILRPIWTVLLYTIRIIKPGNCKEPHSDYKGMSSKSKPLQLPYIVFNTLVIAPPADYL